MMLDEFLLTLAEDERIVIRKHHFYNGIEFKLIKGPDHCNHVDRCLCQVYDSHIIGFSEMRDSMGDTITKDLQDLRDNVRETHSKRQDI